MKLAVFDMSTAHEYGAAFYDFLGLRKRYFVDALGWDIPHDDKVEMDQYDTPQAIYSVVIREGRVIAGARLMSTQHKWGADGYMLGDAAKGMLPGIPQTVVPKGFEGAHVWECTRLVLEEGLPDDVRYDALHMVADGILTAARTKGASKMIALTQVAMMRAVRKMGYHLEQVGPSYRDPSSGRAHAVFTMDPWKEGDTLLEEVAA